MNSAIIAHLGLDTKDFNRDLGNAEKRTGQFTKKAEADLKTAAKASNTLGQSIGNIGKQWISGAIGAFSGALAFSAIYEGIKASRELDKALAKVLRPVSADYSSIEELKSRLEELKTVSDQVEKHLNSGMGRSIDDIMGRFATLGKVIANPIDAWNGKVDHIDRNKKKESEVAQAKRDAAATAVAIANKEASRLVNQQIGSTVSAERGERGEAERKLKEAQGEALKKDPAAREQLLANAQSAHDQEIQAIERKYKALREENDLKRKMASLDGSESQKAIQALEAELSLLRQRRQATNGQGASANNAETNDKLDADIAEKSRSLREAQLTEEMKSPAQRREERQAERKRQSDRKKAEARLADKARRAEWLGEGEALRGTLKPLGSGELGGPKSAIKAPSGALAIEPIVAKLEEINNSIKAPPVNR